MNLIFTTWFFKNLSTDQQGRDQQCGMRLTESWQLTKWSKKVTMKMEYFSWGCLPVPCDFFALESLRLKYFLIPVLFCISDWHGAWSFLNQNPCENQLPSRPIEYTNQNFQKSVHSTSKKVTMKMEYFSWGCLPVPCDFFLHLSFTIIVFLDYHTFLIYWSMTPWPGDIINSTSTQQSPKSLTGF